MEESRNLDGSASPLLFSSDEEEDSNSRQIRKEEAISRNMKKMLSGVPPPPALTLSLLSAENMVNQWNKNREEFSICGIKKTSENENHHPVYFLNLNQDSEDIASMFLKVQERFIRCETMSTCNIWFQSYVAKITRKRHENGMVGRSPGRRLSHLARRRQVFSLNNIASMSGNSNNSIMDRHRLIPVRRNKHNLNTFAPARRNTPSKSLENRLKLSKRALFQSPEHLSNTAAKKRMLKRKLFSSSDKKLKSGYNKKQRMEHSLQMKNPRRSLTFDDTNYAEMEKSRKVLETKSELSDINRKKLVWSVFETLKAHDISRTHHLYKSIFKDLFALCKNHMEEILSARDSNGTTAKMVEFARKHFADIARVNGYEVERQKLVLRENTTVANVDPVELALCMITPRKNFKTKRNVHSCSKLSNVDRTKRKNFCRSTENLFSSKNKEYDDFDIDCEWNDVILVSNSVSEEDFQKIVKYPNLKKQCQVNSVTSSTGLLDSTKRHLTFDEGDEPELSADFLTENLDENLEIIELSTRVNIFDNLVNMESSVGEGFSPAEDINGISAEGGILHNSENVKIITREDCAGVDMSGSNESVKTITGEDDNLSEEQTEDTGMGEDCAGVDMSGSNESVKTITGEDDNLSEEQTEDTGMGEDCAGVDMSGSNESVKIITGEDDNLSEEQIEDRSRTQKSNYSESQDNPVGETEALTVTVGNPDIKSTLININNTVHDVYREGLVVEDAVDVTDSSFNGVISLTNCDRSVENIGGIVENVENIGGIVENVENIGGIVENVENIEGTVENVENFGGTVENVENIGGIVENVENIEGTIVNVENIEGTVENVENIEGTVENVENIEGTVENVENIEGTVENVENIEGTVENVENIEGTLENVENIEGTVENVENIEGTVENVENIEGTVENVENIEGTVENVGNIGGTVENVETPKQKRKKLIIKKKRKNWKIVKEDTEECENLKMKIRLSGEWQVFSKDSSEECRSSKLGEESTECTISPSRTLSEASFGYRTDELVDSPITPFDSSNNIEKIISSTPYVTSPVLTESCGRKGRKRKWWGMEDNSCGVKYHEETKRLSLERYKERKREEKNKKGDKPNRKIYQIRLKRPWRQNKAKEAKKENLNNSQAERMCKVEENLRDIMKTQAATFIEALSQLKNLLEKQIQEFSFKPTEEQMKMILESVKRLSVVNGMSENFKQSLSNNGFFNNNPTNTYVPGFSNTSEFYLNKKQS